MKRSMAAMILPLLLLAGCGSASEASGDGKLQVVATTGMIGDAAKEIGGNLVEVTTLMGPGVDPHLYKASAGDVGRLNEADLVLYNGLHLEAAMADVLGESETVNAVAVAENIKESDLLRPAEFGGQFDPHVWFDVSLWSKAVEKVRDALVDLDPGNSDAYRTNAETYLNELAELHDYVTAQALRIPEERRVIITAHDAFNYFGRAYGFEVHGLQGINTAAEAGTSDVQRLAAMIAARRIPAIFVESSIPRRTVEAVQAAVRARGFEVRIGGSLFS
ncbi:MAG TPA: zinc ABC transporter substrate-binding protein, partial [Actinomycetota bacterium]|nr:zinc ABC transporter substrate-binding protein [Actinomycetota bacterium]